MSVNFDFLLSHVVHHLFGFNIMAVDGAVETVEMKEITPSGDATTPEGPPAKVAKIDKGGYKTIEVNKNNAKLFEYYRKQPVIPPGEFDAFIDTLRIGLPSSFRVQLSLPEAAQVDRHLREAFFSKIPEIQDDQVSVPISIPFVPYGYQGNMPRSVMRSHPLLKNLHEFLVNETEIGVISRQEAVSMVPPLLLDVKPDQFILDMCAAPGSKTMQLIELMHRGCPKPTGLLVANDIDYERCYLLVHQTLKRYPTANCVVVNQDASQMPSMVDKALNPILFDRVLCDVICTGDGTFRKNLELWKDWTPQKGMALHRIQVQIAKRGLEMLKPGGRMVYSTCSLNPIEDEAIVAQLLRHFDGKVRLVDVSAELPELKRSPGISTWKVIDKAMTEYANFEGIEDPQKKGIVASMFPPTAEEAARFGLDRTFRILPHAQNSGGFFIAVLEKVEAFATDKEARRQPYNPHNKKQRRRRMVREDPFTFLSPEDYADVRADIEEHYGVSSDFPYDNLLVRSADTDKKKCIYFVNDVLRDFMKYNNVLRFRVVNAGVPVLRRVDKVSTSKYRLMQDGLPTMSPFVVKRIINVNTADAIKVLEGTKDNHYVGLDELADPAPFKALSCGSVLMRVEEGGFRKDICLWLGAQTVTAFITREEKIHCLTMMGHDPVKLKRTVVTSRQAKGTGIFKQDITAGAKEVPTATSEDAVVPKVSEDTASI
uniref:tRNA (cytosine(34)-C(5))-methyltransferase n=1 Tax=Panagrellus redivivus TaxID=6233 RepID=A0A7E4VQ14_PANRE